jgi:gluconolactonase
VSDRRREVFGRAALVCAAPLTLLAGLTALPACRQHRPMTTTTPATAPGHPTIGSVDRLYPALDALVPPGAAVEQLAEGFKWAEGPLWIPEGGGMLIFSDVPRNMIRKWQQGSGLGTYLEPSGYTGSVPRTGESGSNGLTLDPAGRLVLCQHGDRRMARLEQDRSFTTLADRYQGKRLNSPNDAVFRSNGDLYFTDPPYGLEKQADDPAREIPWSGVFRVPAAGGEVVLLTNELSRPNGLAFSPDEQKLYVANSDPDRAIWMVYDVTADGGIANGRVFFDATAMAKQGKPGLPDGLKIDHKGNLFATGPGGVLVFTPDGKHLGTIETGQPTANCAWGDDGRTLYLTANNLLCRIRLATRGVMPATAP